MNTKLLLFLIMSSLCLCKLNAQTLGNDAALNRQPNRAVTINVMANDTGVPAAANLTLVAPGGAVRITNDAQGDTNEYYMMGEGSWYYDQNGLLTFLPNSGFTGTPTPATYRYRISAGIFTGTASINVSFTCGATDSDSDSVFNGCDLDDDNDGIEDDDECFVPMNIPEFNGTFGTISGTNRDLQTVPPGYTYGGTSSNSLSPAGTYAVTSRSNTNTLHGSLWKNLRGHTTGADNDAFLAVNGSTAIGTFYFEDFNSNAVIQQNTNYRISMWGISAATNTSVPSSGSNPANIEIRIIGYPGAVTIASAITGDMYDNPKAIGSEVYPADWHEAVVNFNSGTYTGYRLEVRNISTLAAGNDFAIDDIMLSRANCLDTDGDGTANLLDRDSDGDTCPDAREGDENVVSAHLLPNGAINTTVNGGISSNGIPNLVNTGGGADVGGDFAQGVGQSQNSDLNDCVDTDNDNLPDWQDLDDDNDGILDVIECPGFSFANGDMNAAITTITSGTHLTQTIGGAAGFLVDYKAITGTLLIDAGTANQLFATSTPFRAPYPDLATKMSITFSKDGNPISPYISFMVDDIDQGGEIDRITIYDEFGNVIPSPAIYLKATAVGTSGTYPGSVSTAVFNDLGTNVVIKSNSNYVQVETNNTGASGTFFRPKMVQFDFMGKKVSKIEIENVGTGGQPGFFINKIMDTECDTDGDNIPNRLDLDSDGDGCPDAREGDENIISTHLLPNGAINTTANGGISSNGIPNLVNTGGGADVGGDFAQGVGQSQNSSLNDCIDSDNDNMPDWQDLDDDNDGILDCTESAGDISPNFSSINGNHVITPVPLTNFVSYSGTKQPEISPYVTSMDTGTANHIDGSGTSHSVQYPVDGHTNGNLYFGAVNSTTTPQRITYTINFTNPVDIELSQVLLQSGAPFFDAQEKYTITANSAITVSSPNITITTATTAFWPNTRLLSPNYTAIIGTVPPGNQSMSGPELDIYANNATTISFKPLSILGNVAVADSQWSVTGKGITSITISYEKSINNGSASGSQRGGLNLLATCVDIDTDGDNIPNRLDLDSDGDGCSDAWEGDENVQLSQLNPNGSINTATTGGVNANGVPNLVNSGGIADVGGDLGQGTGDSLNPLIKNCPCYKNPTLSGTILDTNTGISSLGRGNHDVNGWPEVRKGAWIALESKTKGFVANRIATTVAVNAIAAPVEGMMVYDEQADCLKIYTSTDNGVSFGWHCFNTQTCPD